MQKLSVSEIEYRKLVNLRNELTVMRHRLTEIINTETIPNHIVQNMGRAIRYLDTARDNFIEYIDECFPEVK